MRRRTWLLVASLGSLIAFPGFAIGWFGGSGALYVVSQIGIAACLAAQLWAWGSAYRRLGDPDWQHDERQAWRRMLRWWGPLAVPFFIWHHIDAEPRQTT
jgi:hypothetical protein